MLPFCDHCVAFFFLLLMFSDAKGRNVSTKFGHIMVLHVPVLLMTPVNANVIGNLELVTSFVNIWFVIM